MRESTIESLDVPVSERERGRDKERGRESAHLLHQGSPGEESKRDLSLLPAFAS